MKTAEDLLKLALADVGIHENPVNSNNIIYNREFYGIANPSWTAARPGPPYCQAAGYEWQIKNGLIFPKTASTGFAASVYEQRGKWHTNWGQARPADQLFMTFSTTRKIEHTGYILKLGDGGFYTVEANTSPTDAGDQRNGGGVYKKFRPFSECVGFGRPDYADASPLDKPQKVQDNFIELGDHGHDVRLWQHILVVVFDSKIKVDGEFGAATEKATKDFEKAHKLKVDGRVLPHTIHDLEAKLQDKERQR